ncbi:unnamed protein product [Paramecium sonneborni]|uniref:Calpain-like protein n=1 Tax=Paramecium sonneborni TaxID=65129 RepID=A0A8S1Q923_9CILI|nr:unnamed protein product [Paramecium sonneborni]
MQNYSDQILLSLLKLGNKMDSIMIIKRYGYGIINQQNFLFMIREINNQIPLKEIENFYQSILKQYEAQAMSAYILNELLRQASQIQAKYQQNFQPRSPNEIFYLISKSLQVKNQDIDRIFIIFDQDKDNLLNEIEFKVFLEYYVPTLTQDEYAKLRNQYSSQMVSLYNLMSWMQESSSIRNSIKVFHKPQKDIQQQQIEKKREIIPNFQERYKETTPVNKPRIPQKPEQIYPRIETPQKQQENPQKQQIQNEYQKKYSQQQQQQQIVPSLEIPQRQINPILESILYEDPAQANLLKSDIQFEKYIVLDQNLPGISDFLKKFNELFRQKQIFTDTEFPANVQSLGSKLTQFQWKRLKDIWPTYEIFVKDITQSRFGLGKWISPKDICQGQLGDCYFLSVLSSMACRWPDFLLGLFLTQQKNQYGIYAVRLCIDGIWKAIFLDDYVPTQGNQPAFSSSPLKEIWVLLMEKAWAKSFGSYSNIISGHSKEVIHSLTGGPTWSLKTNQPDFKEQFIGNVQRKCLMTTGTFSQTNNSEVMGLIADHAYSILKIRVVQHPLKGEVTLIKLRNPWGKKEWQGEWCDDSSSWTKELKKQLRVSEKAEDGIFYMSFQDFVRYFNTIYVGYFQQNYIYKSQTIVSKKNKSIYFVFNIDVPGQYYFTAQQKSQRHFKDKYTNYEYSPIRMMLAQVTKKGYELEYAKQDKDQLVYVGELFDKGQYMLQVKINWLFLEEEKFVISSYGPKEIKLKQIQKDQNFFTGTLLNLAKQNPKKEKSGCPNLEITSELSLEYGAGYEYYLNTGNDIIEVSSSIPKMIGIKLKKPERGNQYKFSLNPNSEKLITFTIQAEGFQFQQSRQYRITRK